MFIGKHSNKIHSRLISTFICDKQNESTPHKKYPDIILTTTVLTQVQTDYVKDLDEISLLNPRSRMSAKILMFIIINLWIMQ